MFPSLIRRSVKPSQFNHATNPYKAKKVWPPDFSKLSNRHQFRLERRYRRRTSMKWARPNLMKVIQLTQWGAILAVVVYGVLFLELPTNDRGPQEKPFKKIRGFFGLDKDPETMWDERYPKPESAQSNDASPTAT